MEKRLGVVGIVVEDISNVSKVNGILHDYANIVVGRMGVPYKDRGISIISIIVDGSMDQISAMTGKLGKLDNISVKTALTKA